MRRGLLRLPILVVIAIGLWLLLGDRPRRADLVYDLQDDPRPSHVDVRIVGPDGRTEAALSWEGQDPMPHHPLLPPGEHRLLARVVFPDGTSSDVERPLHVGGDDGTVIVHLP